MSSVTSLPRALGAALSSLSPCLRHRVIPWYRSRAILDGILRVNAPSPAWLQKVGNDQHVPRFARARARPPWRHQRTAASPGGGFGYRFSISAYSRASAWTRWPAWYALSRTGTLASNVSRLFFSLPPEYLRWREMFFFLPLLYLVTIRTTRKGRRIP